MYDILVKNGWIVDGAGNTWYKGDVAVEGEIIKAIGKIVGEARELIDANGFIVSPGFIDVHSHSDLFLISQPDALVKLSQGITTEIIGQDGLGEAPIQPSHIEMWRGYLSGLNGDPDIEWKWSSFASYLDKLEEANPALNVGSLVGHGNIRLLAIGMDNRKPTPNELEIMKETLAESLVQGALGLSTGLIYPPCVYSDAYELTELCKVVSDHGGIFVVHMRNEGDRLLESIDEVISIGRESKVPVHISHFKTNGKQNWGKAGLALERVEEARLQGIDVTFDQYPYTAGSTFLGSLLPPWAHEGGLKELLRRLKENAWRSKLKDYLNNVGNEGSRHEWDRILITNVKTNRNKIYEGKYVSEIAETRHIDPAEVVIDLVLEEENAATMASFTMHENDIRTIMRSSLHMVCTDGILLGKPHPRAYGSFPRVAGRYVREGVLRLEEAIRKMTSYPAQRFGLHDRGLLRPGFSADIVIFKYDTFTDRATFENPIQFADGVKNVIVNGTTTIIEGERTGARNGKILRKTPCN